MQQVNTYDMTIQTALKKAFEQWEDDYEHETESNYVPYGDTYVNTGDEPTDESEEQCLETFKETLDLDLFVRNWLLENADFRELVEKQINAFRG